MGCRAFLCGGAAAAALGAPASGQGCPAGLYQYGPATWDPEVEQIVVDHYALSGGPLTPTAADYERAERDVGLIRAAFPGLPAHHGAWEHRVLLVETNSLTVIPTLTCTNTYFQARMMPAGFGMWWIVEFPRGVNQFAVADLYNALPEVTHAEVNAYGSTSCSGFDAWSYEPLGGTWRWGIIAYYGCGPGLGGCCSQGLSVSVSAAGVLCVAPDCNGDGALTGADFACFQARFVAGDPYADCNRSGSLTVADFGCFQATFVQGCP